VINPTGRTLVSPADFYLLAGALEDLIEDQDKRQQFGKNNRIYMETEQYSPTKILREREEFYRKVLRESI